MKSLTGKFLSARGWAITLILLFGAGLFVAACGDEEVPSPTTPAPPPPAPTPPPAPEPEPAPEPPAVPVGLRISASGMDFIEWSWNAVEGVSGYDVQYSADEAFNEQDETIARTAEEISYRREGLEAGASAFLRVRAAAGMGEERVTSDWSTHVTGMTAEPEPELPPAPAAPANLRLKERGSDFIEWEWDEVAGADGYQSEFSTDGSSFGAQASHSGVSNTSRRVANLAAEAAGHLRVRSYTGSGTGTDTVRGDWSASDRQTTDEPPPAVALDAPDNFESSDPDENSIRLEWDDVDDADYYDVEQRVDGARSWSGATCGEGGSGSTEDTSCVATGLDPETDYEFRVRAASDDDAHPASSWSETEGTTADDTGPAVVMGSGDLNLIWSSDDASMITFTWDQISGAEYEWATATSASGCEDATYADPTAGALATFHELDVNPAGAAGSLCVRTKDKEHMSFAKGVALPNGRPTLAADAINEAGAEVANRATTAITWTIDMIEFKAGFDFDMRVVADPQRDDKIKAATMDVQDACLAGTQLESGDTDVNVTFDRISLDRGLQPYTGYLLCLRMMNDSGATEWVVPASNAEALTLPARPPAPRLVSSLTRVNPENAAPVWSVATRGATNIPRLKTGYEAKSIVYPATWDHDDMAATARRSTPRPTVAVCQSDEGLQGVDHQQWTVAEQDDIADSPDGIVIGIDTVARLAATTAPEPLNPSKIVLLCVRATVDTDREGPWVMSSSYSVPPVPRP